YTVTGVMPATFHFPVAGVTSAGSHADVWLQLDVRESAGRDYFAYGRRKPGVAFAAAEADVKRVAAEIAAEDPAHHPAYTARLFDLRETIIRDIGPTLMLLLAAAGLLFLITCGTPPHCSWRVPLRAPAKPQSVLLWGYRAAGSPRITSRRACSCLWP